MELSSMTKEQYKAGIMREIAKRQAAEASADEYAESCGGKVYPNDDETWVECVNRLAGELASRDEREHAPDIALSQERDELAAQLATAQAERDAALVKIKVLFNIAHQAVGHVAAANYPERESLAHKWIDDEYERKP